MWGVTAGKAIHNTRNTLCTTRRKYSRLRVNVWKRGYGEIDNISLVLLEFQQCHELPNGNTYCAGGGIRRTA